MVIEKSTQVACIQKTTCEYKYTLNRSLLEYIALLNVLNETETLRSQLCTKLHLSNMDTKDLERPDRHVNHFN